MLNPFLDRTLPLDGPATDLVPVTPNDAADLPDVAVTLYVETGGAVRFVSAHGDTRTVVVGDLSYLPVGARRILSTGTTATGIHALMLLPVLAVEIVLTNTDLPVISGNAMIGETLLCSTGTWTGGNGPDFGFQWLRDGIAISSATDATYTLGALDDAKAISCQVTASEDGVTAAVQSATVTPAYPAPTVIGAIDAQFFVQNTGVHGVPSAAAFDGSGIAYALIAPPSGVSVHNSTGVISVDTSVASPMNAAEITVEARNSGGAVTVTWALTLSAVALETETRDFLDRADALGSAAMSVSQCDALNDFYISANASTWWSKVHRLFVGGLNDAIAGAIDLTDQTTTLTQAGSSDMAWTSGEGWNAEGIADRGLDMHVDPFAVASQNDISLFVWYTALTESYGPDMSNAAQIYLRHMLNGSARGRLFSAANADASGLSTQGGFRMVNRTGANPVEFYGPDGTLVATKTRSSDTPVSSELFIGASQGVGPTSDRAMRVNGIAGTLTSAEVLELRNALSALLAAFPGGAPQSMAPPTMSGAGKTGQQMAAAPGSWAGAGTYSYMWLRDGAVIAGAVGATYTPGSADIGTELSVAVTATNANGSATALSAGLLISQAGPQGLAKHPAAAATSADQLAGYLAPTGWGDTLNGATIDYLDRLDWSGAPGSMKQIGERASTGKWSFVIPTVGGTVNVADSAGLMGRDNTWYAFECGPGEGVEFVGNEMRVTSSNTMVGHGKFRPGPSGNPDDTDAMNVRGGSGDVTNVKLYNCSFQGSNDESVGIDGAGDYITHLSFVDCLLGYPMNNRNDHIYGPYFLDGAFKSEFVRSMLVGFRRRCFGIEVGSRVGAWGCLLISATQGYVTGRPIHFIGTGTKTLPAGRIYEMGVDADGCVAIWNSSDPSDSNIISTVNSAPGISMDHPIQIWRGQNAKVPSWVAAIDGYEVGDPYANSKSYVDERTTPSFPSVHSYWSGEDTRTNVPLYAGARPAARDGLDQQLIADAMALNLDFRTSLPSYSLAQTSGAFTPVANPFELVNGVPRIVWQIHDDHHIPNGGIPFL